MNRALTTISSALFVCAVSAQAQRPAIARLDGRPLSPAQIDATVNPLIQAAHVTGAGVALFHGGKIVYLKAYGMRDTEKGLPLTPDSVMTAASLTKSAFATVVMRLVQRGALDLDKPIEQYLGKPLGDFDSYADLKGDPRTGKLTLRILLDHTTGFANFRGLEDDHKLHIHYDPGTHYGYSGEGIVLAQFVVEKVTGKSATQLMQEELYGPLKMTRSSMVWEPRFESDFANGYDEYGRSLGPERRKSPNAAGSMQTTPRDYALFLSALMRREVLNARTLDTMLSPQIRIHSAHQFPSLNTETTAAYDPIDLSYGIGWGIYKSPYGPAFFKEGHDEGWRNLALCLRNGDGLLAMTNSSNGEGIFKPLVEALLGQTGFPFDWDGYTPYDKLPPLPKLKEHKRVTLTSEQLNRLAGRYALSTDIVLTITVKDGHLYIRENDEPDQEYLAESPSDFYSASSTDECTFSPDTGPAQVLVLHLDSGQNPELKRVP
ncbi:MAG TPA: serine hydrolase [Terracidiphilus sp.]|nr:serine hydrolase [Terracidiphilus sp.]